MISSQDWNFRNTLSVDEACDNFTSKITDFCRASIPNKEVTIRPNDKPWFDSQLRTLSRQRDRQKARAIKSKNLNDWNKYKILRNKVNNMKKNTKVKYFYNLENVITESDKSNPKLFWKILKQLLKSNENSETIPAPKTAINGHGKYCFTDQETANCLNDYFSSITSVDDLHTTLPTFAPKTENSLSDIKITETEITEMIATLDPNKAVGEDLISYRVLKATKHSISKPLCMLFNKSFQTGIFPAQWKSAIVMPLYTKVKNNFLLIIGLFLYLVVSAN